MSKVLQTYEPAAASAATLSVPIIKWADEYRPVSDKAGDVEITSVVTPLDAPSSFHFAATQVANVYSGISPAVPANYRSPSAGGVKLLIQNTETWSITDSADPSYQVNLPVEAHLVVKVPQNSMITATAVEGLIKRTLGGLYDGNAEATRLESLLRKALMPSSL